MDFYPSNGDFFCAISNGTISNECNNIGTCISNPLSNNGICNCPIYLDPLTRCNTTVFESMNKVSYNIVSLISIIASLLQIIFYGMEVICSIIRIKNKVKIGYPTLIAQSATLFHGFLYISTIIAYYVDYWNNNIDNILIISIIELTATTILGISMVLLIISYFALIANAKKLEQNMFWVNVAKITSIVIVVVFGLISYIIHILAIIITYIPLLSQIAYIGSFITVTVPIIFALILAAFCAKWIAKLNSKEKSYLKTLKIKTILLTIICIYIILTFIVVFVTSSWPRDLANVILFRKWQNIFTGHILILLNFVFLQNHAFSLGSKKFLSYSDIFREKYISSSSASSPRSNIKHNSTSSSELKEKMSTTSTLSK